jgi:hypothetical protein
MLRRRKKRRSTWRRRVKVGKDGLRDGSDTKAEGGGTATFVGVVSNAERPGRVAYEFGIGGTCVIVHWRHRSSKIAGIVEHELADVSIFWVAGVWVGTLRLWGIAAHFFESQEPFLVNDSVGQALQLPQLHRLNQCVDVVDRSWTLLEQSERFLYSSGPVLRNSLHPNTSCSISDIIAREARKMALGPLRKRLSHIASESWR